MTELNNNSVKLNAFGTENLEYIKNSDMDEIIDNVKSYDEACSTPSQLVRLIHFHPEHPENHNLKLKDGSAYIYNGDKWDIRDKEQSINILVDKAFNMIVSYYNRRKKLYREKNKIITKQKELYEQYPELKDEIYKKLKIVEEAPIVIEPILSNNINDDIELKDSIFGLYSNDFLQEYFDARNKEIELSKSENEGDVEELEMIREKINMLDKEEEKVIYSSSEDRNSEEEQQINIEEDSILNIVEDTIINNTSSNNTSSNNDVISDNNVIVNKVKKRKKRKKKDKKEKTSNKTTSKSK
tara:strand:- start:26 stop:919 length:894 start_codon:yes stop_codon:yes gene_type:complete